MPPPLIVILGPTSCGKTKLAVKLAKKFNGEIVSADSRQVYRGLDIGTGKDLNEYNLPWGKIPYHLIDVANPQENFSLAEYQKKAYRAIDQILKRKKLPFLVGGTGLYIKAITDGLILSSAKPDYRLRKKLELMSDKDRLQILKELNPEALKQIDTANSRRVIRAIEICKQTNQTLTKLQTQSQKIAQPHYATLILGITHPIEKIRERIKKRLQKRLKQGLVAEVQELHKNGLSWKQLIDFGLEYRYISYFLKKEISYDTMIERLLIANGQLAKKQMTWFKKDSRIKWIKSEREAEKLTNKHIAD
ncbi:MAG: tRNA (adenosine(37)-N6)-dimethylallyltransferase MiaA [Patescibacteria group bacterium]|nr:tRNA (adenosine(37)-N6)-dimethylallyltransferase MiaA [Patescibacteria group bacterium]